MHFIIGFALVLLSGSVAAQQGAVDESTAVQVRHSIFFSFFLRPFGKPSETSLTSVPLLQP